MQEGSAARVGTEEAPGRPLEGPLSLVLVTLDTTRADALGAYGQRWPTSPHIDRLAAEGVLFERVETSNPETLPAHATLFTGRWPFAHGVRANSGYVLSEGEVTLAEVLADHGYETAAEVAAPVLRRETQITQGFAHYRGAESSGVKLKRVRYTEGEKRSVTKPVRVGSDITTRGIDFLRRHGRHRFFLWLHYFDAHDPYFAPAAFNDKIPQSPYHAEVAFADSQLGLFLAELERLGLRERTLVVVTADHGEGLGEHEEPTHSFFVYETTMRVPLILWSPASLPRGRRIPSSVRSIDILPTLLELLQVTAPAGIQGTSLTPLISGNSDDLELAGYGESTRFLTTFGLPMLRFLRVERWKYIHKVNPELYDLWSDPAEVRNLATQRPELVAELGARLKSLLEATPAAPDDAERSIDARRAAELMALGYVARSPSTADAEKLQSLALDGADPRDKMTDAIHLSIGQGLVQRGEFAQALEEIRSVQVHNPQSAYVSSLIATVMLGLGRDEEAARALRQVLAVEPCDTPSRDRLARRLRERREYAALLELLASGAESCPSALTNLNNYAWALATLPVPALRDGRLAEQIIREALARATRSDPAYLDTLAAALAEQGRFDEAIDIEKRVIEELRSQGAPAQLLGELNERLEHFRAGRAVRVPAVPDA